MIYLLLSILTTTCIVVFFKLFDLYKVDTFLAILVNYFTAATCGFLFSENRMPPSELFSQPWFPFTIGMGALFILIFMAIALTTQKVGLSAATVANKMSLVIPVTVAIIMYGDSVYPLKIIGLVLAVVSVVLASVKKEKNQPTRFSFASLLLPAIVFAGSGAVDTSINYIQRKYVAAGMPAELLITCVFAGAFVSGLFILVLKLIRKDVSLSLKTILFGAALGLINYFSVVFMVQALNSGIMEPSVLYPVNNMAVLVLAALTGYLFFREKISRLNLAGLLLALVAIVLITIN